MPTLVIDANILIDVEVAGLTSELFGLKEAMVTPDVLYEEELSDRHTQLRSLGLRVVKLTALEVAEVQRLTSIYRAPSTNDLFALSLAKSRNWALLSGDKRLREAARSEGTEVYGTLWLMKRLNCAQLITINQVSVGFERMRKGDRRLPWKKVEELLASMVRK